MSNDDLNYDAIRARAEKRARKRAEFNIHFAIYVLVNLFLWVGFFVVAMGLAHNAYPLIVPLLSTVFWGLGVVIHFAVYYFDTTGMDRMRDHEFQREIEREMRRRGSTAPAELRAKPKRDRVMRLSDDGELIEDDDAQPEPPRRQSNRNS